jgi:5-methylthioadenosine/S-adenosylhomocysteine deaminase
MHPDRSEATTRRGSATTLLIRDAAVFTSDDVGTTHDIGWVYVRGNTIEAMGAGEPPLDARRRIDVELDGSGCVVMPGMVNAHTHLFQTFFRGLGDDKPLLDWLRDHIWPAASIMTAEEAGAAATIGLLENLRSGATTVIDHQYVHPDEGIDDAVCGAAERSGARFVLARGWADRNYEPRLQEPLAMVLERMQRVADCWHERADGRIRVETAPLIPWGCSDAAMTATTAASRAWGGGMHVHCAETATEVEMNLAERSRRHVAWLHALGVLGPDVQLVHSVWLDDHELELVASSGACVVHCPVSNMYLASGVAPVPEMLRRGIPVALATDGPGSNNRQDMFEVMKVAVLLQKVHHLDAMILQPEDALRMATRHGARAAGLADGIGAIEPGRLADLVVVDLRSVFVGPVHRVASALVFNVTPRDVRHVVVDGRLVIRSGTLADIDEQFELARATELCAGLFARARSRGVVARP